MCPAKYGVEGTEHYLLLCQSYEEPRRELLNGLNAILPPCDTSNLSNELLIELILYGNERLPFGVNSFTRLSDSILNLCCKPQHMDTSFPSKCNLRFILVNFFMFRFIIIC